MGFSDAEALTAWLLITMFSAPRILKLCLAASHRRSCISLYNTLAAFLEKNQESTPIPPVRSATDHPSCFSTEHDAIRPANSALYEAVEELLHCSAESLAGKISEGLSYHSCTFPLSLRRLSMQATAISMSIWGHLLFARSSFEVSSAR